MTEKISIIVPVYNAETTLERCVSALISQTYRNIEIILVNDGSKDNSLVICRRYELKDSRIRVIDKPNGGVSSARNAGLEAALGDFVMFCDSDDWAEPDWCEELISHYEDGSLVMCGHYVEGEQSYIPHEIRAEGISECYARNEFFRLKLCNFNAPWNKIFKRSIVELEQLRFEEWLTNGEDYLFILRYLNCMSGDIVFLSKCVFHYEWPRKQSLSQKVPNNYFAQCCMLTKSVLEQCEKLGLVDEEGQRQIITDRYNEFQKIILSVIHNKELLPTQKIKKIGIVMSSPEYQLCANNANISPNRVYCWLARKKNGFGIWLWHLIRD